MRKMGEKSQYDKFPEVAIAGGEQEAWQGWPQVVSAVQAALAARRGQKTVLVVECYHGVAQRELLAKLLMPLRPAALFDAAEARRSPAEIDALIDADLTDDPVFGRISTRELADFFDPDKRLRLKQAIAAVRRGLVVVVGTGAALMADGDLL
ncbi:mannose-6-phosphate isomerase, partial [Chimaeribacter californicus]